MHTRDQVLDFETPRITIVQPSERFQKNLYRPRNRHPLHGVLALYTGQTEDKRRRQYIISIEAGAVLYYIQLKKTSFPAGKWPDVFELFVHEDGREEGASYDTNALSYAWTSIDADRIGINLRWMQASCSIEK